MVQLFDGEQKLSRWPKEVVSYLISHPKNEILVGQSVHSCHTFMANRMIGKKICIGYNSKLKCFVMWNAKANIDGAKDAENICLKLSVRSQRAYAANPVFTAFYEPISPRKKPITYQKICVFPETDFMRFYDNYEIYMPPSPDDHGFRNPAAPF